MARMLRAEVILRVALFSLVLSGCVRLGFNNTPDGSVVPDGHVDTDTASDQRPDHAPPADGPPSDLKTAGDGPVPDFKAVADGPVLDSTTGKICSWSKPLKATGDLHPYYLGVDPGGNIYIAGEFKGTSNLGPSPTPSVGGSDIFLASYSSIGALRWSKHFGSKSFDEIEGLGVSPAGGLAIVVRFSGSVDFGGGAIGSAGKWNGGVARYNTSGTHIWSKSFDATSMGGVVLDGTGVTVSGGFWNSIGLGGTTLTSMGYQDIFLARYNASGTHIWSKSLGGTGSDAVNGMTRDALGNLFLVGTFDKTANFGGKSITSVGWADIFLASYTISGSHRWSLGFGSVGSDSARSVTTASNGDVLIVCGGVGDIDFGGGAVPFAGANDGFVASFNSSGTYRWAKAMGGTLQDTAASVTTDTSGNVYVAGSFTNSANLGGGTVSSAGGLDGYLSSFTSTGAHRFAVTFGGAYADQARGAAYSSGAVVVAGSYTQQIDLGCGPITGAAVDGFLARLTHP